MSKQTQKQLEEDIIRETNRKKKERAKNSECYQIGFMIYLMVKNKREVVIQRLEKKSKKTEQFYRVIEIRGNETFKLKEEVEKEAKEQAELIQNITQRKRYYQKNCSSVAFNWIVKILQNIGYSFEFMNSKESINTVKMKRFKHVHFMNEDFPKEVIEKIGKRTLNFLGKKFEETKSKEIVVNSQIDFSIEEILEDKNYKINEEKMNIDSSYPYSLPQQLITPINIENIYYIQGLNTFYQLIPIDLTTGTTGLLPHHEPYNQYETLLMGYLPTNYTQQPLLPMSLVSNITQSNIAIIEPHA
ncbi:hypothetical protein EDI_000650 [Entamoeba dispar SAW760]|uniref:Uncharacterized protein n=1 Tax=Entamoeba dispar (strain ATCC PRA-260 / SAW760) TaxID=370354 RepID=B0EEJ0_ENTDS|nr:uncharacterized protein EDI_000650 [Entamoeba dispar SAW760]EDR27050.1 hypothetical protein EDI_000650 [Entamoeba dispar SAW760]|eukprot:EDR27050.1 hypothetical protein EDI_000650 [Entamoeba dispar SAW760]